MGVEGVSKIQMVGSIPDLLSAISISGEGNARVKIDFAESEIASVVRLLTLKGQSFRITIEPEV